MNERKNMREVIDRVAERIRTDQRNSGKEVSHDQARAEAVKRGIEFEKRQEDRLHSKR